MESTVPYTQHGPAARVTAGDPHMVESVLSLFFSSDFKDT